MKKLFWVFFLFLLSCGSGFAGQNAIISLSDGNTLYGEVLSFENGVYTIRTAALGLIRIPQSNVVEVRPAADAAGSVPPDVSKLEQKMKADQESMALIYSLQNDPDFQAALNDPAVMNAVTARDVSALMKNPKFMQLLQNAKVKQIQSRTK